MPSRGKPRYASVLYYELDTCFWKKHENTMTAQINTVRVETNLFIIYGWQFGRVLLALNNLEQFYNKLKQ